VEKEIKFELYWRVNGKETEKKFEEYGNGRKRTYG
jgi:hypothetical protein